MTAGKFWQFGIICVFALLIWKIDSADWAKIADSALKSPILFVLGWILWVLWVPLSVVVHKLQRDGYRAEINRLVEHRNELQEKIGGPHFQSSDQFPRLPNPQEKPDPQAKPGEEGKSQ